MAQIWIDDENAGALVVPRSNRKVMHNTLGNIASAKKSVLSKLDNVMHHHNNNKLNMTPFKGANQMWPKISAPKLSLCKETLQKQHREQINKDAVRPIDRRLKKATKLKASNNLYARSADPKDNFDLFDFMDFPSKKCLKNCHKPMSQNWMKPLLNEDLIDKLLNHSEHMEEEIVNDEDISVYRDLDTVDFKLEPLKYNVLEAKDSIPDFLDDLPPLPNEFDDEFDFF